MAIQNPVIIIFPDEIKIETRSQCFSQCIIDQSSDLGGWSVQKDVIKTFENIFKSKALKYMLKKKWILYLADFFTMHHELSFKDLNLSSDYFIQLDVLSRQAAIEFALEQKTHQISENYYLDFYFDTQTIHAWSVPKKSLDYLLNLFKKNNIHIDRVDIVREAVYA